MKLTLHPLQLDLKHPFTISRWTYTKMQTLVVELQQDGISGYGEATRNAYYPNTEIDYMSKRLKGIESELDRNITVPPDVFWEEFEPLLKDCLFALCALEEAYHDWYTKKLGLPLYQYWELDPKQQAPNCYTLSIDEPGVMIERMKAKPWPVYKIKLGTDQDIHLVEQLRQHTKAHFWVDANCAWTVEETIDKSKQLAKLGVTFIEQPLAADDWPGMAQVFKQSALPIIADESCKTIEDIEKCKHHFHGINIKVMKCGGLTPARKMIEVARSCNLKVMLGCMTESTVGISAIAHLNPLVDYADMDGQHFIKNDPTSGVLVTAEGIKYASTNGTGVAWMDENILEQ